MIKGATLLINGIPGRFLDPFHLADSQADGFGGYILIGYEIDRRQWDMVILQGRSIIECARIDEHHRQQLAPKEVEDRFHSSQFRDRSRVFLFEAPPVRMDPFLRTLSAVPTLKVQVDPLSREQLIRLIRTSQAPSIIAERSVLQPLFPLYEFLEIKSPHQPIEFQMRFRKGLLLLYSLEAQAATGAQLGLGLEPTQKAEGSGENAGSRFLAGFCQKFAEVAAGVMGKNNVLAPGSEMEIFARIPEVVRSASAFRRSRLRRKTIALLNELYNDKYEELKAAKLLGQVEECYRQLKG